MNKAKYSVEKMCALLAISRTSYYRWLKVEQVAFKKDTLKEVVLQVFKESKSTYGSPRIFQELKEREIEISKSSVARIMKVLKIKARSKKKFVLTTDSSHELKVSNNKLDRQFKTDEVNKKWVSDITYIPTKKGWTYLTIIMDLAERMIVSWHLSKDMTAKNTTVKTMKMALNKRKVERLLFHSDRGVQYCCSEFRAALKANSKIEQSMSRKGNCWDNAPAESFFKTLKVEWVNRFDYIDYQQAKDSIFDYIERWYNTRRKHSGNNYMSPLQKHYFLTRTAA